MGVVCGCGCRRLGCCSVAGAWAGVQLPRAPPLCPLRGTSFCPQPRCSDPCLPWRCPWQWRRAVPAFWRPLPVHWRAGVSTCRQHPAQRLHPTCLGRISLHPRPASCPPLHAASPASATRAAASNISCPTTCLPAPSLPIVSRLPVTLLPRSCPRPQPTGASASCAGGPGLSVFSTALVNILFLHPAEESGWPGGAGGSVWTGGSDREEGGHRVRRACWGRDASSLAAGASVARPSLPGNSQLVYHSIPPTPTGGEQPGAWPPRPNCPATRHARSAPPGSITGLASPPAAASRAMALP